MFRASPVIRTCVYESEHATTSMIIRVDVLTHHHQETDSQTEVSERAGQRFLLSAIELLLAILGQALFRFADFSFTVYGEKAPSIARERITEIVHISRSLSPRDLSSYSTSSTLSMSLFAPFFSSLVFLSCYLSGLPLRAYLSLSAIGIVRANSLD